MKIKIQENSVNIDDLKLQLAEHFSSKYEVSNRSKDMLIVAQSKTIGATVMPRKKSIIVNANFPTMQGQMVFTVLLVGLGILIPLVVYFFVYHKKMKVVEKDVGEFIKMHYRSKLL